MKIADVVLVPVSFTSDFQTERERAYFAKMLRRAKRQETRLSKAGFTMRPDIRPTPSGDILYESHYWVHEPSMDTYCNLVVEGIKAGRIKMEPLPK